VVLAACLLLSGCGGGATTDGRAADEEPRSGAIVVSAAASLTESFTTIRDDFVEQHPGADVTLNFGSSGALSTQIAEGAPADVAAFADTTPMTALADAGLVAGAARTFARNQLVIVTQPGNPAGVASLADLAGVGVVSLCVNTAPCGSFAEQILDRAGVTIPESSVTRGPDATSTLGAVTEGDAVAGIVYLTDAASAAEQVETIEIPEGADVVASYPIAVVRGTGDAELAEAFLEHVLSEPGQAVLARAGFLAP
jgi:molybdate transport system substrate-binding protein